MSTTPRSLVTALSALLLAVLVAACATVKEEPAKIMKAAPAPDSGFLTDAQEMEAHRERAPFDRAWANADFAAPHYQSILVAPVNTKFVLEESRWAEMNLRDVVASPKDDLDKVAGEFRQTVIEKFRESKTNRFAIVDRADDQTMIFELAVTELVPGKAFVGAVGLAAWAAPLPIGIPAGAVASFADVGWMAIEGRVRDAKTGDVIAMFADREQSKTRVLDLKALTWYGNAHESMDDWAGQFVALANTPSDVQV